MILFIHAIALEQATHGIKITFSSYAPLVRIRRAYATFVTRL